MAIDSLSFFRSLTFKHASGPEAADARGLFQQVYSEDIKYVPSDALDQKAAYLIALAPNKELIASLRFVGPELRPFEIEAFCDLSAILEPHRVPALIGRLSVRRDYRKVPGSLIVHFGLLKLAIAYGAKFGVTDLFLYTLPHLIHFYEGAFFRQIGCKFAYKALAATMHIMRLNIDDMERLCREAPSRRAQLILLDASANFII